MRIYAFLYQLSCFKKYSALARNYLLEKDRQSMTQQQRKESQLREKAVSRSLMKNVVWNLVKVFSPWYRPHTLPIPKRWRAIEAEVDTKWMPAGLTPPAVA
jgi:hypothetical protein